MHHQRQFLPFADGGAPSIRSLARSYSDRVVLVTTDRSVSVLRFDGAAYSLQLLALEGVGEDGHVVTAAAIERPGAQDDVIVVGVAVAQEEKIFLLVVNAADTKTRPATRFELPSAPAAMTSVRATSGAGEVFAGVMLFCADAMLAFGFIVDDASHDSSQECVRLSSEQFANFFPEFAAFARPVLAVDALVLPASDASWIAFGCADGFVRVLSGRVQDTCSCGPYATWDLQIDGPVTSVSLFATEKQQVGDARDASSSGRLQCNVLATCAIGHALVVEDVFGSATKELLEGSDQFDSIFAGVAADVDLDGRVELLLGTDDQELLVYKRSVPVATESSVEVVTRDDVPTGDDIPAQDKEGEEEIVAVDTTLDSAEDHAPTMPVTHDIPAQTPEEQAPERRAAEQAKDAKAAVPNWTLAPKSHVQVFGAIYSLAWVDVNCDGVKELLLTSSTGVFIFEADARLVLQKLQALLSAVASGELKASSAA